MTKKELRTLFLEKRRALSEASLVSLNLALTANFFGAVDLSFTSLLHTYLPIVGNHEPDTLAILDRIRREFPQVHICIPRVSGSRSLDNILYEGPKQLEPNKWGIPEPRYGTAVEDARIDLVIVPLLAIDQSGHRVGYGRGFYDQLLNNVRSDCRKIGLSFFDPVDEIDDIEPHDVMLDACVTPAGTLTFSSGGA